MKITKDYLKRIIKEEMNKVLKEQNDSGSKKYYKTYFDFSGVTKTKGNKLDFSKATGLNEKYDEMYIDDSPRDAKERDTWAKRSATEALRGIKNPREAKLLMDELLGEYKDSIEKYVNLVNEVAGREVVSFDYEAFITKDANHILAEMIKLLSIGKRFEDYDEDYDY